MLPEPLHPAVVHFPIVLAVLLPVASIITVVLIRRGAVRRGSWIWAGLLAVGLAASSWFAVETGEDQEDTVEQVVAESAIHDHEEAAETFLRLSVGGVVIFGLGLVSGRIGSVARYAAVGMAVLLLVAGYRVGKSGGELVYEHGAARAYPVSVTNSDRGWDGARFGGEESERPDDGRR